MWIILEGADGSGKSTLSRELNRQIHESRVIHLGPPESPDTALDECLRGEDNVIASYRPGGAFSQSLICDRLHWGSPVYGPIFRPESDIGGWGDLGRAGWEYVEMFVAARGGLTVMIDVEPELAIERLVTRGDDYVSSEHLVPVIQRYHDLVAESITLGSIFRMNRPADTQSAARMIVDRARFQSQLAARALFQYPGYVGALQVDVIVAGPPSRDWRLQLLESLPVGLWRRIGFTQHMAVNELEVLSRIVGRENTPAKIINYRPTRLYSNGPWPIITDRDRLLQVIQEVT